MVVDIPIIRCVRLLHLVPTLNQRISLYRITRN